MTDVEKAMPDEKDESLETQQTADEQAPTEAELEELIEDAVDGGSWPVEKLKPVLEAALFAAADPLPLKRLADVIDGSTRVELNTALTELQVDFETRGIHLVQVAGGWQLRTAPEHQSVVKKLFKERPFRLTRAGLETLAIVAYRQPATRAEVEAVRGVDCSGVLESLVERKVVKVAGRRDVPGRPLVYVTTPMFLEMFGLKDLKALPTLAELGDEFTTLADHTGFSESEEREAPVLPFEGDDGEGQEQTAGAQDDNAVDEEGVEQTVQQADNEETVDASDEQRDEADEDEVDEEGDIPKIRFRESEQGGKGGEEIDLAQESPEQKA
jgi:segregation and condensation protein B